MNGQITLETALKTIDEVLSSVNGNRETHIHLMTCFNMVKERAMRPDPKPEPEADPSPAPKPKKLKSVPEVTETPAPLEQEAKP